MQLKEWEEEEEGTKNRSAILFVKLFGQEDS